MANQEFITKQNDTKPLEATLRDEDGAIDLTGATVKFNMWNNQKVVKVSLGTVTIVSAPAGSVAYPFMAVDTDTVGTFRAEFQATMPDSTVVTFPHDGYIAIKIVDDIA